MAKKFMNESLDQLSPEAEAECRRLWELREQLPCVTEVTFPLLVQYCGVWAKVNAITMVLPTLNGQALDEAVNNLTKLQKIMFGYANALKLNEKQENKNHNKFYDLLTK